MFVAWSACCCCCCWNAQLQQMENQGTFMVKHLMRQWHSSKNLWLHSGFKDKCFFWCSLLSRQQHCPFGFQIKKMFWKQLSSTIDPIPAATLLRVEQAKCLLGLALAFHVHCLVLHWLWLTSSSSCVVDPWSLLLSIFWWVTNALKHGFPTTALICTCSVSPSLPIQLFFS